jgi:integrase
MTHELLLAILTAQPPIGVFWEGSPLTEDQSGRFRDRRFRRSGRVQTEAPLRIVGATVPPDTARRRATDAAAELRGALHAATHQTLIGLMAVTGMRLGEAIGLDRDDVAPRHGLLRIIDSKFGKSREVVLHASAMDALDAYGRLREELCPRPSCDAFFVSTAGTRLFASCVHRVFARLVRIVGIVPRSPRCRPRPHDYADLLVMPTSSRASCSEGLRAARCRHNQSASRKAMSASGGW